MITVFTPTYNRRAKIGRLMKSLRQQSCHNFEWVIVDDGSKDGTITEANMMMSMVHEFPIRYFLQKNGGKHRAINRGVREARGDLFFIVDSDDTLPYTAIETIIKEYAGVEADKSFAGVAGYMCDMKGNHTEGTWPQDRYDATPLEIRFLHGITGGFAAAFRTDVMRQFPFPEFAGEKFCPEALVWNRIGTRYKIRYFNRCIYSCEYQPDGLSSRTAELLRHSPRASMLYYAELFHSRIPLVRKLRAAADFWRFTPLHLVRDAHSHKMLNPISLTTWPLGLIMGLHYKRQESKNIQPNQIP